MHQKLYTTYTLFFFFLIQLIEKFLLYAIFCFILYKVDLFFILQKLYQKDG